jgi:hypothetical protein
MERGHLLGDHCLLLRLSFVGGGLHAGRLPVALDKPRESALELFQDRRIFQRRRVLRQLLALGQTTQQTTHDLAGTGLRQVVAETDVLRLGDRTDLLAHPV